MVPGAQQSPIEVTETIPAAASASGDACKASARASFGSREVTVTME